MAENIKQLQADKGGVATGHRRDILIENLSERDCTLLVCPRCHGILREACLSSSGEQFCSCCEKGEEQSHPNIHVRNIVLSLKCSCPLYKRGCDWLGTLGECEKHLAVCDLVDEMCKLGCDIVLPRNEVHIHMSEKCLFREILCKYCQKELKFCDLSNHHEECQKIPLKCELNCGVVLCREDMPHHLNKDCGRMVEHCKLGCGIELPRDELDMHVNTKCVQRMIPCEHCHIGFKACDMSNHMEECPKMILSCELKCGKVACREDMARHIEEECVEKEVGCPFIKYKCELGLIKRKELYQHLEEKRTEHTELKLNAMEVIVMKQNDMMERLSKQTEMKLNAMEDIVMKQKETIKHLTHNVVTLYSLINTTKLQWRIANIDFPFKKEKLYHSQTWKIAAYDFRFKMHVSENLHINFNPPIVPKKDQLKWPFRVEFLTRLICHDNLGGTLEYCSELFQVGKTDYYSYHFWKNRNIATFSQAEINEGCCKDGGIDIEIFVNMR
ncbi:TNF receptor-associated factor 4 [Oopsacas minuta]|uniref:TNF receptor-associated factor 4 n=1 Tax=Oopsacas minuta TaxID=111878 RepID=A0AAV7JGI7_9METZ|nr:TNF receptor-associated factor 4 [Oopsacas minuta]